MISDTSILTCKKIDIGSIDMVKGLAFWDYLYCSVLSIYLHLSLSNIFVFQFFVVFVFVPLVLDLVWIQKPNKSRRVWVCLASSWTDYLVLIPFEF